MFLNAQVAVEQTFRRDFIAFTSAAKAALTLNASGIAEAMPLRNFAGSVTFFRRPLKAPHICAAYGMSLQKKATDFEVS
jgi:hypothetical protein